MSICIGGGGDSSQSRSLDEAFAEAVLPGPVVYIPVALDDPARIETASAWFRSTYAPLGINEVVVWEDLARRQLTTDIGGIYIGGGNTYRLLNELRKSGVLSEIISHAHVGIPIYGGSAGAIALGADITTSTLCGDALLEAMTDFTGADLLNGWSVACHYVPVMESGIDDWRSEHSGARVIALPEEAGAAVSSGTLRNVGSTPITLHQTEGTITVQPGDSCEL